MTAPACRDFTKSHALSRSGEPVSRGRRCQRRPSSKTAAVLVEWSVGDPSAPYHFAMAWNVPRGEPLGRAGPHVVSNPLKPPRPFRDHSRLQRTSPISRHRQGTRALLRLSRLRTTASSSPVGFRSGAGMRRIPQRGGQFGGQGSVLHPVREACPSSLCAKNLFRRLTA